MESCGHALEVQQLATAKLTLLVQAFHGCPAGSNDLPWCFSTALHRSFFELLSGSWMMPKMPELTSHCTSHIFFQ